MYIAAAINVTRRLVPAVKDLHDAIAGKASDWDGIVKIGRAHMQDATPITLGQEWSGYAGTCGSCLSGEAAFWYCYIVHRWSGHWRHRQA
jgi:fumarate hydratase class II